MAKKKKDICGLANPEWPILVDAVMVAHQKKQKFVRCELKSGHGLAHRMTLGQMRMTWTR